MSDLPKSSQPVANSHAGHEHFACACGESFHSQAELKSHAAEFHAK